MALVKEISPNLVMQLSKYSQNIKRKVESYLIKTPQKYFPKNILTIKILPK